MLSAPKYIDPQWFLFLRLSGSCTTMRCGDMAVTVGRTNNSSGILRQPNRRSVSVARWVGESSLFIQLMMASPVKVSHAPVL